MCSYVFLVQVLSLIDMPINTLIQIPVLSKKHGAGLKADI